MNFVSTFCLTAIVFLSLPLPLFASATLGVCESFRRELMPWVWVNVVVGSLAGIMIILTPLQPLVAVTVASATFILCGMQMFRRITILTVRR